MPETPKVAVIGIGHVGGRRTENYIDLMGPSSVVICDTNKDNLVTLYQDNPYIKTYPDHVSLLEEEKNLQLVHISVPATQQAKVVLDCLYAGNNVVVEKPFTASYDEALSCVKLANGMKKFIGVLFSERLNPPIEKFKTYLQKGNIPSWNTAKYFREERLGAGREAMDVEVTRDLGSHSLDMPYFLTGERPKVDFAGIRKSDNSLVEIPVTVKGVLGTIYVGWEMKFRRRTFSLTFPHVEYIVKYASQELYRIKPQEDDESKKPGRRTYADVVGLSVEIDQRIGAWQGDEHEPFSLEQKRIIESARAGKLLPPLCDGEQALPTVKLIDEIEAVAYQKK
jgi:predicted dehydrogenase